MSLTASYDQPLPTDLLELAELGFELRDLKPAVVGQVIDELLLLAPDAAERSCGVILQAFQLWRRDQLQEAAELASQAVDGLADTELKLWLVRARSVMCGIAMSRGAHHEAIAFALETLDIAAEVNDRSMLFVLNHNLGAAFSDLGDIDNAERRFAMAEVFASDTNGDWNFLASNRARMYLTANRPHEARAILDKFAYHWAAPTASQSRAYALGAQCDAALAVGELDDALHYLELTKDCCAALDRTPRLLSIIESRVYLAHGRLEEAKAAIATLVQQQLAGDVSDAYASRAGNLDLLVQRANIAEAEGDFAAAFYLERQASDARIELLTKNNHQVNTVLLHHRTSDLELRSQQLASQNDQLGSVVSELQMKTTEALELTCRDFLTGLHNRRYLDEEARRLLDPGRLDRGSISLLVIDVDDFKSVNDNYLHMTGDEVLKKLAELMLSSARKFDIVCRHGGDEFVMLLPSTNLAGAAMIAARLESVVQAAPWHELANGLHVSITCGVAEATAGDTLESLLLVADRNMFEQKPNRQKRRQPAH